MQLHSALKNIKSSENSMNAANIIKFRNMNKTNKGMEAKLTSSFKSLTKSDDNDRIVLKDDIYPSIEATQSSFTSRTDITDVTVPTKNTNRPPLSLESGRNNLRKAILNRSSSLTEKERSFLEEVLNDCRNVEILQTTTDRLQKNHPTNNSDNDDGFSKVDDEVRSLSSSISLREAYPVKRVPSENLNYSGRIYNRLHPSLSKRRKDLHKMLWDAHSARVAPKGLSNKVARSRSFGLPEINESSRLQHDTNFSNLKLKREISDPVPQSENVEDTVAFQKEETKKNNMQPFHNDLIVEQRNWQNTRSISVLTDHDDDYDGVRDERTNDEERTTLLDQTKGQKLKKTNTDSTDDIDTLSFPSTSPSLMDEHNHPFPTLPVFPSTEGNRILNESTSDKISSPLLLCPFNEKCSPQSNKTKENHKKKGRHRRWHSLPNYPTNDIVIATEALPMELDDNGAGFEIIHSPTSVQDFDMDNINSKLAPIETPKEDPISFNFLSSGSGFATPSKPQRESSIESNANKHHMGKKQGKHRRVKTMPPIFDEYIYVSSNKVNGDYVDGKILKQITSDKLENITSKKIDEEKLNEDEFNLDTLTTSRHPLLRSSLIDDEGLRQDSMSLSQEGSSMVSKIDNNLCSADSIKSWEVDQIPEFSAWSALKDEYSFGYGHKSSLPFKILGTHADDMRCHPHVLSPPLMESLQNFLPESRMADNYWLKYSMVRDGASLHTLLRGVRGSQSTILAIETTDGQVFGSYTSTPWRKTWGYFGNGECFVWKMRKSRNTKCYSILEQARLETEIEVFTNSGKNDCYQACNDNMIAIGGSVSSSTTDCMTDETYSGFSIALTNDLAQGTSSPCSTFNSPCLTNNSADIGSVFEILNVEVYSFTPFDKERDAERNELMKMYIDDQSDLSMFNILIGSRKSS